MISPCKSCTRLERDKLKCLDNCKRLKLFQEYLKYNSPGLLSSAEGTYKIHLSSKRDRNSKKHYINIDI